MLLRSVFARAADGLTTVHRDIVVGDTLAAFLLARQENGSLGGYDLEVRLVLLVSERK